MALHPVPSHAIIVEMTRSVFYSFHYDPDCWRAAQIRSMGALEGNAPTTDNDWETITKGGDAAIERWIAGQMSGRTCVAVLIGSNTANRKWINYEIVKAWNDGKGVFGVYIHNLKDTQSNQSPKGGNPFDYITMGAGGSKLSSIVRAYDPPPSDSTTVYAYIKQNIANWVDAAVIARNSR